MKDEIKEIDRIIINVKRKLQFSPERRFVELFNKDEINKLLDYITNLQEKIDFIIDRNDEKQNRIDKAIEFIDKYCIDDEFYINLTYKEKAIIEVKKILKGSYEDDK